MVDPESLGGRIRASRKDKQLRQVDLAKKVGISRSHMNGIEYGRQEVGGKLLKSLADVLGVSVDYLLGRESLRPKHGLGEEAACVFIPLLREHYHKLQVALLGLRGLQYSMA